MIEISFCELSGILEKGIKGINNGCIDSLEVRKKPGGHWIIRDLSGLDLVGLASL
ncbi:hypothetical protein ACRWG0_20255 [Escherichia coli]